MDAVPVGCADISADKQSIQMVATDVPKDSGMPTSTSCSARGVSISVISARLQLDRKTVRRYVQSDSVEHLLAPVSKRGSALDEHMPYLRQRWDAGCTNALRLLEELRGRGYNGSHRSVRRLVQSWRGAPPAAVNTQAPPKPRVVAGWMTRPATALTDDEKQRLQQILAGCDTLRQVNHVADFAGMVRERGGKHLDTWIAAAKASGVKQLVEAANVWQSEIRPPSPPRSPGRVARRHRKCTRAPATGH
ncbi:hypothetical protein ACQPZ2_30090 [Nocardia pseudovaccinii]|uniref:hypothetical protein n=1 Tax=Nocardia pseudovaccinii TaxID=189540 RepID=UPI003D8A775F